MTMREGRVICDHCGEEIPVAPYRHTWIGPLPEPGQPQRHYHLAVDYPQCRMVGGADPMPGELEESKE